jgi:hypothetical protein
MSGGGRPLSKRNADALARVTAGPVLASELHATAVWVLWCQRLVDLRFDSADGPTLPACVFGVFPPAGTWVTLVQGVAADRGTSGFTHIVTGKPC